MAKGGEESQTEPALGELGEPLSPDAKTLKQPGESESQALARASFAATMGVLLSRMSGLVRSQVVGGVFGASTHLDAFYLANRFPNALRDLFADGALSAAFTKTYVSTVERDGAAAARRLVEAVLLCFGGLTLCIAILGAAFAEPFLRLASEHAFEERGGLAVAANCFRFLAFYLPLTMLSAVAMAILASRGQTFRATIASSFFNVGMIAGAFVLAPLARRMGFDAVTGLAFGTLGGGILQFVYLLAPLRKDGAFSFPRPSALRGGLRHPGLREILRLMVPRFIGQGATAISLLINSYFVTQAGEGALTYITNAMLLVLVPVGLFGVAAGFASLPVLTRAAARGDGPGLRRTLGDGLGSASFLTALSLAGYCVFAIPLCYALFRYGRYTGQDALATALALCAYAASIPCGALSKVLLQGFYALGDTKQVIVNSFVYFVVSAGLSALLAPRFGVVGLGLAVSMGSCIDVGLNAVFLERGLRGSFGPEAQGRSLPRQVFPMVAASVLFAFSAVAIQMRQGEKVIAFLERVPQPQLAAAALLAAGGAILLAGGFFALMKRGPLPLRELVRKRLARIANRKRSGS